ncbi:MDR family MFS transporter [Exiguobacterium alkaliphilum]|uniref:MDR family MFS transporter n=1 Tax=Exiguobacterium alkaliphilum TaxID=1428684 RepID=UPI001BA567AF|nr:MFS transporter [Exiguobacterium alkaliphilum]QUE87513.1 MFS transporter [Exiguobacterium alkaliphilum]
MNMRQIHPLTLGVLFGTFFARLSTFFVMPFFAIYLATLGFSASVIGTVFAVSAISGLFMSFFGGTLSDRHGRKQLMLIGIGLNALTFTGFALATELVWFYIFSVLMGVSRSFLEPASRALISDTTKPEQRVIVYNVRYFLINIAAAIGPLLAVVLSLTGAKSAFFIVTAVYVLYGLIITSLFRKYPFEESDATKARPRLTETFRVLRADKTFRYVIIGMIFAIIGYSQFNSTLPQFIAFHDGFSDGSRLFAYLLTVNAITVLIVQYPIMRFGIRVSPIKSLFFGVATLSIGLLLIGFASEVWVLFVAMVIFTVGEVLMFTMTDVLTDELAPEHLRGTYFGAMGLTALGQSVGPIIGGLLLDGFNNAALPVFGSLAVVTACGAFFFMGAFTERKATLALIEEKVG